MRPEWLWDRNLSVEEIQEILKNPNDPRFVEFSALLLSRNNAPQEVFNNYLNKTIFVKHWSRVKRQMRKNTWNDPRVIFWQAVYNKLAADFKEEGIAIRPFASKDDSAALTLEIARKIKACRQHLGMTQEELAQKVGISQQIISRVEKGRADIRLLSLEKIARGLGKKINIEFA